MELDEFGNPIKKKKKKDSIENIARQKAIVGKNRENIRDEKVKTVLKDKASTNQILKKAKTDIETETGKKVPSKHFKAVEKILSDDIELQKSMDRSDPSTRKKKPSVTDQLVQAMVYMTPQLIGMALGGAMEGEAGIAAGYEGAVSGQQAAMKMGKDMQSLQAGEERFQDQQDPQQEGLTPNQRLQANLRLADVEERQEGRELREKQGGKRLYLKGQQMRRLSDQQMTTVQRYQETLPELEKLSELTHGFSKTGVIKGRLKELAQYFGFVDLDFAEIQARIGPLLLHKLHALSGTAVREDEKIYIENTIIPSAKDEPPIFAKKLQVYFEMVKRNQQQFHQNLGIFQGRWGEQPPKEAPKDFAKQGSQYQVEFKDVDARLPHERGGAQRPPVSADTPMTPAEEKELKELREAQARGEF